MGKKVLYNPKIVEKKWQDRWEKEKIYNEPDLLKVDNHFYNLWMFPYPSGEGLHAGHAFASTGSDIYGRFMRMQGKNVFQPIGYDSFGIHTENYALKVGERPESLLEKTTKHYEEQLRSLGHGYDWTRTVTTSDIDYYKWTQWIFIQLYKAGLAYRAKSEVNWCPSCKTVLADEQVIAGKCERCGTEVIRKDLEQWFFRIKNYADRLLNNLEKIDWSERVKIAQRNWIGRSEGALIKFALVGIPGQEDNKHSVEVFTTRPDTLNSATFLVISPELAQKWIEVGWKAKDEVKNYIKKAIDSRQDRFTDGNREKTGIFAEFSAIHPLTDEKIPVWISDYILADYGTGAIMGVPGHDERDEEFAKQFGLSILKNKPDQKLLKEIEEKDWGKHKVVYHLRDWLISRQRYWGPPIPMIFCASCEKEGKGEGEDMPGWWTVPESDLPVKLPYIEDYQPKGTGVSPLAKDPNFYNVKCPGCGKDAKRETDVSDTFLDSSWYFLRYPSVHTSDSDKVPFDPEITKKWLPVDFYFGGAEHSVLHLMYARFVTMVLFDLKKIHFEEPFPRLFAHGLLIKEGSKMSKSRGNVVNPDSYIEKFGADALRMYLVFMGPMDGNPDFRDTGIEGMKRFIERVWKLFTLYKENSLNEIDNKEVNFKMHQTINNVTKDIQKFHYNTAISSIMEFVNLLYEKLQTNTQEKNNDGKLKSAEWNKALVTLVKLLSPFAPHICEEIWVEHLGCEFTIHKSSWPQFNPEFIKEEKVTVIIQINGKLRSQLSLTEAESGDQKRIEALAKKDSKVIIHLQNKSILKTIFIPGKLINFVI